MIGSGTAPGDRSLTFTRRTRPGRLVTTTNALSGTVTTTYDALGRRVATTDPLGHTTVYTYDGAGRVVEQRIGGIQRIRYGYDSDPQELMPRPNASTRSGPTR